MTTMNRRFGAALMSVTLLGGLAACGDGGTAAAAAAAATAPAGDSPGAPAASGASSGTPGKGTAASPVINMKGYAFAPATVTAKPGQSIKIVNSDNAVHDVTDSSDGIKSGNIPPNGTGTVKAPKKKGTYKFVCTFHPGMTGTMKVS